MMEHNPVVSIITPVLNGIEYLEGCIESVLNQSYPNIEHIIVDGGSSDGTLDMLTSYAAKYPDIIRFFSGPDKNATEACNKGLRIAKGDIMGFIGSDDMYEPDAIQTVVEFFRTNEDAYFVYGDCNIMNVRGEVTRKAPTTDFDFKQAINTSSWSIPTIAAFFRRAVIDEVGLMDSSMFASDIDYWVRCGKQFRLHRIRKVLANYRMNPKGLSGSEEARKLCIREHFIISRRYGGSLFSPCARSYYRLAVIEGLRPILGRFYPFINRLIGDG